MIPKRDKIPIQHYCTEVEGMKRKYSLPVCLLILIIPFLLAACSFGKENNDEGQPMASVSEEEVDEDDAETDASPEADTAKDDGPEDISARGFEMMQYENARFGYTLSYPDLYDSSFESDSGDGVSFESADGRYGLLIWASNNLETTDGASLLNEVKESVSHIQDERSAGPSYTIIFEGGDETPLLFVQSGYAGEAASVHFRMSFPADEKDDFADILTQMESELSID